MLADQRATAAPAALPSLRHRKAARIARRLVLRDAVVRLAHRRWRRSLWSVITGTDLATVASAPVVYSLVVPFAVLDGWVAVYQAICFRAWGIRRVRRRDFIAIDRHKLAYLNGLEKLNCLYCSYVNGLLAYVGEVAARTEQYWCPIKHARRLRGTHLRYAQFVGYGDASGYRKRLEPLRDEVTGRR
jgi:hypothetical protein